MPVSCYLKKTCLIVLLTLSVQSIATNRTLSAWVISEPLEFAIPGGTPPLTITYTTTGDTTTTTTTVDMTVSNAEKLAGHGIEDFVLAGTSGDPGEATTLDSLDSSQFLRSDVSDSFDGTTLTINGGTRHTNRVQIISGGDLTVTGSSSFYANTLFALAPGTAPFTVLSTTTVDRLSVRNADMLDGHHATDFILSNLGNFNTALGPEALDQITTGSHNIALGYRAGHLLTSNESFDICIGNTGVPGSSNTIRIGDVNRHHRCNIAGIYGNTASQDVFVMVGADGSLGTMTSSKKFKTDIKDMGNASADVCKLRPVTFKYKPEYEPSGRIQYGLIAEEVEAINPELVVYDTDGTPYTVRYAALIPMLVNEYQQQQKQLDLIEQKTALCGEKKNVLFGQTPHDALCLTFADTVNPAIITLSFVSKAYAYTTKFIFDGKGSVMFANNTTADNIPVTITASINKTTVTFKHKHPSIADGAAAGTIFYEINGEDIAKIS